ncbi:FAD-dependent monooxygenase [Streptomyces roseirectus]|uniref:FAD-dependent monooxygenase n=1 Tax=Streptomyces roseirectus TaxID=2768066 RepID=A0A7H0IR33_9ACTN|nr:FAD-dependent monooxygenase [Streptomyces roseirectus]QNP75249.1 FAD-dependent monooxygenase [Streptomyces roseirectus]
MRGGRVAIVGGSIAGCAASIALERGGAEDITVYERAADGLAERGVGVAVHNARHAELESAGYIDAAVPWVPITRRRWYVRDDSDVRSPLGRAIATDPFPFHSYNWGPLWRELRGRVPATADFRAGSAIEAVEFTPGGAEVHAGGRTERYDVVIGADGYRSTVRAALYADVLPEYAGYLAWRGAYPVERLGDAELWAEDECAYVVFPGGHLVVYRIPDGAGGHRVNWVLYTVPPAGLDQGMRTPTSLPPGTAGDGLRAHLAHVADELLPAFWGGLVRATTHDELFLQPLYDFTAPHYAVGRAFLVGDAATVARPHTGAGAVKALQDATVLEAALTSTATWTEALAAYDADRAPSGQAMVELGRRLGRGLVLETPEWGALDQESLGMWWAEVTGTGPFGGRELKR